MKAVQEILGAVNYWVSSSGIPQSVGSHVEWACKNVLRMKVPMTFVTDTVYMKMFRLGWMRVAILSGMIKVDYSRMTREQADWLQQEANKRGYPVVNDMNKTIMEPEAAPEGMAESVVNRLLD